MLVASDDAGPRQDHDARARQRLTTAATLPGRPDEPDWRNFIRAAVRECVRTWELQARTGPVKLTAREAIVSRAVVLLMQRSTGSRRTW
jgi:hypothetical protein